MVMKYALREKDIIIEKTTRADSDKKCKAAQKERDEAVTKMKTAVADKTKFQHLSDSRVSVLIYYCLHDYNRISLLQDISSELMHVSRCKKSVF